MSKDLDEELFDKYSNLVLYSNKMKTLKNVTSGHKQRFINMVLELLKFRGKNLDAQIWIYYTLIYFQSIINKYLKAVDQPVAMKLQQQIKEVINSNPYKIEYKTENKNKESTDKNTIKKENEAKKEKSKEKNIKDKVNTTITNNLNKSNINIINDDTENKIKKKMSQIIEKINKYNSFKDFILNSVNKENRSNTIFCEIYQFLNNSSLSTSKNDGNISINIRQKMLNLICLIFPFISNKQKVQIIQKMKDKFEVDAINILENSKFIDNSKKNNIFDFLILSIIKKEINMENLNSIFKKKLFVYKVSDIIDLFKIFIIIIIFKFKNYEAYTYQIAFKIKFLLDNYLSLYSDKINLKYEDLYNILLRLKKFYIHGYNNKFSENDDITDDNNELELDLFSNEEKNVYNELYKNIAQFYSLKKNIDLVSGYAKELKNFEFPFNMIELIQIKNNLIKNDFQIYKSNLINIEKRIYKKGYESLFPNIIDINTFISSPPSIISFYSINENLKNAFYSLDLYLHKKLFNYNFKLYPYGSSTEFLSDKDSDIDLFLDTSQIETNEQKIKFLYNLIHYLKKFDKHVNSTISTRVCVITFKYYSINFDMSIVGFCPYLHSLLIREYSLIDPRFPLLLITIKHMIKLLKINNVSDDRNHSFLNSFSWSLLLIAFLQDIVQPPVLPKILSDSEIFITKAFFGYNKVEKEEEEKIIEKNNDSKFEKVNKIKNFESFINNMELYDVHIPLGLGNAKVRKQNYENQIKIKNNMTCAELLLKFLEFVIFHFKYDTLFVNCSFTHEGIKSIDAINYFTSDDDSKFLNYFKTKYIRRVKDDRGRDGYFLFRDPFDPRYNPGQTLKGSSLKKFFSRLKMAYYNLLKYGDLSLVKRQIIIDDEIQKRK